MDRLVVVGGGGGSGGSTVAGWVTARAAGDDVDGGSNTHAGAIPGTSRDCGSVMVEVAATVVREADNGVTACAWFALFDPSCPFAMQPPRLTQCFLQYLRTQDK